MNKTVWGRRSFLRAASGAFCATALRGNAQKSPNVIVIFADDLGFGDLGCYGSSIPTPNLDRMAEEGAKLNRAYSASPVCSPSRAALLSGRYPARTGVVNVLMPDAKSGLNPAERTIPKVLKEAGYRTACIGKWHLGTGPEFRAKRNGFDEFYGVQYSNDMQPLPMLRDDEVVEQAPAQNSLIARFTAQAVDYIRRNKDTPFFLYMAHTAPHIPLAPSAKFAGKSGLGAYGDVVTELDWSVGEVLEALKANGVDDNTLVIFTSDNGPWFQGSSGRLRGRKGSTYEGGVRVPFLARFPGKIPANTICDGVASTMDVLPTVARLAGNPLPADSIDGVDITSMLTGEQHFVEREALLFFDAWNVQCVRWGPWKLHVARYNSFPWTADPAVGRHNLPLLSPELYHIDNDPGESYDRAPELPHVVADLKERLNKLLLSMPEQVRTSWRDTQARRVQYIPVGSLPVPD